MNVFVGPWALVFSLELSCHKSLQSDISHAFPTLHVLPCCLLLILDTCSSLTVVIGCCVPVGAVSARRQLLHLRDGQPHAGHHVCPLPGPGGHPTQRK